MIKELIYKGKKYTNYKEINRILADNDFHWLIDSELSNAFIGIVNDTIVWYKGDYLSGNWKYGIFKDGNFHGNWLNGIFEGGNFNGNWKSGIDLKK